jgi:hypothetical protein
MSYPGQWIGWDRQVRAKDCDDDQTIVEMTYAEFRD